MDIFNNNHEVLSVGGLTIENHVGQITIYGDLNIAPNEAGRKQAQLLADFFGKLAQSTKDFDRDDSLNSNLTAQSTEKVDNPFMS
ncbi:hypothetical protein AAX09_01475 [Moraxella bovoculi]|uniref:hypothetical protein n=1 Tax=Moraxella bovoculi TaxID=386891 RepID=UPI000624D367|nr:hypothetical protein [Moraxella bovoculi]AKG16560.1 hypothetical protein AAX10_01505 [Moraxella bovoculi]AKG18297.1 hypothetical protein AAX09_01475 [Moraxella bovoculi]